MAWNFENRRGAFRGRPALWLLCLGLVGLGCGGKKSPPANLQALLPAMYPDTTLEFPSLRYTDGSPSLNDRCPVRKAKLNRRLEPLFVNGRPIGFC